MPLYNPGSASGLSAGSVTTVEISDGTITTTDINTTSFDARYGKLAGSTWTGSQDFTGATVTGITGSADKLGLTPTAVKTAGYTAAPGDLVPVDTTSAVVTVTLPTAPADGSVIGVQHAIQGSTNAVAIARGGSDVFRKASGATSLTLALASQGVVLQYKASTSVWYVIAETVSLATTDARYAQVSNNLSDVTAATARTNLGLGTAATISSTAGGDLSGTLPSPTVAKVNGITISGTPSTGYVPTATSSTTATWQTAASRMVTPVSGERFGGQFGSGNGNQVTNIGDLCFSPIWVPASFSISTIWCYVASSAASAVMRLGLYASDSNNVPSTLLLDAGTVDASTTGIKSIGSLSLALTGNTLIWGVAATQVAQAQFLGYSTYVGPAPTANSNTVIQNPGANLYRITGVTGALTSPVSPTYVGAAGGNYIPLIGLTRT